MNFNPLPLCRGRRSSRYKISSISGISILSLYAEGDRARINFIASHIIFQSSPSMQRETSYVNDACASSFDISILSLYAEGDIFVNPFRSNSDISILSLYAEGDLYNSYHYQRQTGISILSLYAEGDMSNILRSALKKPFQSSPSMQRETSKCKLSVSA